MIGFDSGSTIRRNTFSSLHPSIRAASSSASGSSWKKLFTTIR